MKNWVRDIAILLLGAFLIALAAQWSIALPDPVSQVPVTPQTLVVLCLAFMLPQGLGRGAVILYILAGIAGLPVFSEGRSGLDYFVSSSAGYLIGFLLATVIIEYLVRDPRNILNPLRILTIHAVTTGLILMCGALYLGTRNGFGGITEWYILPFLPGAAIKVVLGATIVFIWFRLAPAGWRR